uniref:Uncharacterized protein n=1 Tax=Falco tinnunculus TaxID=100819 RepID=A0A8C4TVT9_FALTI
MADDPTRLRDTEMSDQVLDPPAALRTDKNYAPELALAATVPSLSNDQVDFNLVLEESEDGWRCASNRRSSLEHPEKEGFQPNNSLQGSEASDESSGVFSFVRKKCLKRIVSDGEDEDCSIMTLEENQSEKRPSPLSSSLHPFLEGISASTPKSDRSITKAIFSPQPTNSGNRSTASRQSLINKVIDEVEDIEEIMGTTDEDHDDGDMKKEQDDLVEEEAEECSGESAEPEEEPAGETLDTAEESFHLDSMLSEQPEADETESPREESTGDAELQSGEQIDYFTQENISEKETGQNSSPAIDYDTLVDSGKKLKNDGKLQEALNCFLQALDIRSGDPEVMLMTLNLYRQLAQK